MFCANCNTPTNNPKFCSQSCSASYTNRVSPKRRLGKHSCKICLKPIKAGRSYCQNCFGSKTKDLTLEEAIYRHLHRSSAFALVRSRARAVFKGLPQVCQTCGYDKHVEVCHIKPIKDFPLTTRLSEINSPNNLLMLCPNCHWEFDHL